MKQISARLSDRTLLLVILVISVLVRLAAALFIGNTVEVLPGTFDQLSYHHLALRLLDGHGFTFAEPWWPLTRAGEPTAHWSYLYTGFLTAIYSLFGASPLIARLIQALVVGLLHPYIVYKIGRLVFNAKVGLLAAAITALYAYFIYYAATLMTEPFYITAILGSLYLLLTLLRAEQPSSWKRALALGLLLGAAVLLRQLFLLVIPFLFAWLWLASYLRDRRLPLRTTIVAGLVIIIMILPFTLYNSARFDNFVLLNTNAGFAFFWANHPIYGTQFQPILPPEMGSYQELIPRDLRRLDEAALDRALLQRGLQFIIEDPVRYARLSLSRVAPYFMFWPAAGSSTLSNVARVISFGLLWPFMLIGLILAFWRQKVKEALLNPAFLLLLFAAVYTVMHILSWTLIRYRLPVDAVMILFAAHACALILGWLGQRGRFHSGTRATVPD